MRTWVERSLTVVIALGLVAAVLLVELRFSPAPQTGPSGESNTSEAEGAPASEIDWDYWRAVNPDVVAWVRIENTNVDYPIVQARADDPEFYLTHDVYGHPSDGGCPYVDADCADGLGSANVVILGHHMNDGSMFAALAGYHDQSFAGEHPFIMLLTPEGSQALAVTSSRTIPGALQAKRTDFLNKADLSDYKAECFDASGVKLVPRDVAVEPTRLYTFVTCSYFENPADERTLVYATDFET